MAWTGSAIEKTLERETVAITIEFTNGTQFWNTTRTFTEDRMDTAEDAVNFYITETCKRLDRLEASYLNKFVGVSIKNDVVKGNNE